MTIHELRHFRLAPGVPFERMLQFFQRDGRTDLRAALRAAGIPVLGAWRRTNPTKPEQAEFLWFRAFESPAHKEEACARLYASKLWKERLEAEAEEIVAEVEAMDLTPLDARALLEGPRARGFHELRHYRLATNAMPKMLAFFEDVRRLVAKCGVRVLASWAGEREGTERFLWLREFENAEEKVRVSKEIYESERWLSNFKPRAAGVIEERILADLEPLPAAEIGGHDAADF